MRYALTAGLSGRTGEPLGRLGPPSGSVGLVAGVAASVAFEPSNPIASPPWASSGGEQLERVDVGRAQHAEVAAIEGRQLGLAETFHQSENACVHHA